MDLEQGCKISGQSSRAIAMDDTLQSPKVKEENAKYSDDASVDRRAFGVFPMKSPSMSMELSDAGIYSITDMVKSSGSSKGSVRIIPNDRRIPISLQDDVEEVLGIAYLDRCADIDSKGVKTYVSGVRTTGDSRHSAAIINSTIRSKDPPSSISYNSELSVTRSQLNNVNSNYQRLKERFHKLHEDYYKLIRVAGELTMALENSVRGNSVDLPSTLKSCMDVYPDLFNQNVRDDPIEMKFIKSETGIQHLDSPESKRPILGIIPISPKLFDYKKIKLHLINGNVKTKLLLLQALRWKITLNQPAERDEAIHEYTSSDLLGLHGQIASDSGKSILPYLLIPLDVVLPHPLQQSGARLLNTLASFRCGRDYLSVGPTVLNVVIQCLDTAKAENVDAFTCDMIIAMLQKMSLRRQQRLYMIGMGLVEWLVYHLKAEHRKIGTYRLEYATALLMNLSLDREAQVRAATMSTLVLSTLTELLSSAHLPAIPYVIGALNSFLMNHTINGDAKKIDLDSILEYHRNRNSGEIRKNLDYVLRRSYAKAIEDNIMVADDDSEELEVLENELDELDPVKVHAGELFGEALLATCYSISPSVHPRSSLDDDNEISSPKNSETSHQCPMKQQPNGGSNEVFDSSSQQIPPRFALSKNKLMTKNPSGLRFVEIPGNSCGNSTEIDPRMIDRSVDGFHIDRDVSEWKIDSLNEITSISQSIDRSTVSRHSSTTAVDSMPTLASESAADVEDRTSSIASL